MHNIRGRDVVQDRDELTGKDTALSAWESGEGNTPDMPPHPKLAALKAAFAAHADVCALEAVLAAAMKDAGDPVPVTVEVQPGLLALLAHVERLDAARAGRTPAPPSHLLTQRVSNQLENLLHMLVTDPTSHPHYARLWNALCAAEAAPELAVPEEPEGEARAQGEEGPF